MKKIIISFVIILVVAIVHLLPFSGRAFIYSSGNREDFTEGQGYLVSDGVPHAAPAVNDLADKVIACESSGNPNAIGDKDYPHQAYGLIQVQKRTWKWLSEKMGFEGDIENPQDQRRFLIMALEQGHGKYWSCYKKVLKYDLKLKPHETLVFINTTNSTTTAYDMTR